jgi:hypothetical protein
VQRLYQYAGTVDGPRNFQNNVLFLVADAALIPSMVEAARHAKAVERLVGSTDRTRHLSAEQQKKLRDRRDAAQLQVRESIQRCYRFLYYPSAEADSSSAYLSRESLPAQEKGEVQQDQSRVLLETLKRLQKVYVADDDPIDPQFIKSRAWPVGRASVAAADLKKAFARRRGLRILIDTSPLRKGILEGVRRGTWVYYDPREGVGYGTPSPTPLVDLDGDAELLEPADARSRGIPIKGEQVVPERCPVCGNPVEQCTCGDVSPGPVREEALSAEGAPDQALQSIADQMYDRQIGALDRLFLRVQGADRSGVQELRSLGLAVPQLGPGNYWLEVRIAAEFGDPGVLRLEFRGPWDRYRRLKDSLEALLGQAQRAELDAGLVCDFDAQGGAGERLEALRDVLRTLNVGRVKVTAEPKEG